MVSFSVLKHRFSTYGLVTNRALDKMNIRKNSHNILSSNWQGADAKRYFWCDRTLVNNGLKMLPARRYKLMKYILQEFKQEIYDDESGIQSGRFSNSLFPFFY